MELPATTPRFSRLRRLWRESRLAQLALIVAFWALGDLLARLSGLPVPGGVIGMVLMLVLLLGHGLGANAVRRGANLLLGDMLLFFVPAVVGLLDHREFLGALGLKVFAVILVGTLAVMAGTALTVELMQKLESRHAR